MVSLEPAPEDRADSTLRPQAIEEFVGQEQLRANLKVFIAAARSRGEALDHVLFFGPPGLGKTTLAQIVARELGVSFRATSGPVIARAGELGAHRPAALHPDRGDHPIGADHDSLARAFRHPAATQLLYAGRARAHR